MGRRITRLGFATIVLLLSLNSIPAYDLSDSVGVDWFEALRSPDIGSRHLAINAIQTLDNPFLAEACLPLLQDPGDSIRRQAARAIGSRFDQIPKEKIGEYVAALRTCEAGGPEDVTLLCQRAIGLLTRKYKGAPFSVSPDGKWVLYERRRLAVIADAEKDIHHLLHPVEIATDPAGDPQFSSRALKLSLTNEPASDLFEPHWHPNRAALAFTPRIMWRFYHAVCIWSAERNEVIVLSPESDIIHPFLKGTRYPDCGVTSEFVKWNKNKAIIRIYDCASPDGIEPHDPGLLISYDLDTGKAALEP